MNAHALEGRGAYPLADAARLAHMPQRTVRRWIEGYGYKHRGENRRSPPIAYLDKISSRSGEGQEKRKPDLVLDFESLLTLLLVRAFNTRGLSIPRIRKADQKARDEYGLENPFATAQFRSDGSGVFIDLDPAAKGKERQLINVLSDQRQFRDIVEPSLFKDVVFAGDRAGEWWPMGMDHFVVLDPARQFGAPHVAGTGVRTDVVADLVRAEGGDFDAIDAAANWFGITHRQAKDAYDFQCNWLAQEQPG